MYAFLNMYYYLYSVNRCYCFVLFSFKNCKIHAIQSCSYVEYFNEVN